ncbi:hypothetical protein YY92_08300 [Campylobacter fetus]|uniref:hypothetical protein n=1 Tax=Campylobacter fetus TaxID=196 RepID=UPI0011C9B2BC|nr:hypothetical protein [Campylobacter fetus]EAJ1232611.1 hypothetical protein [Campylobacter fetus]EAK0414710.1 hypothetical protein [Campylobacter fetus]TXF09174.1 hypothetical protein FPD25_03305 [Campylobacter fetus subsp. fetus]
MTKTELYEQALESLKRLIKAEKEIAKKQERRSKIDRNNYKSFEKIQLSIENSNLERIRLFDDLHADLVDAGLCEMRESYETRQYSSNSGFWTEKYIPKVPNKYKNKKG